MTLWTCPRCGRWEEVGPIDRKFCAVCYLPRLNAQQIKICVAFQYPLRAFASQREPILSPKRN
jgi:NMD protein affecting ribosome stability and mRNA decay